MSLGEDPQSHARRLLAGRIVAALFDSPTLQQPSRNLEPPKAGVFELGRSSRSASFGDLSEFVTHPDSAGEPPDIFLDDAIGDVGNCRHLAEFCNQNGLPILCAYDPERKSRPIPVLIDPAEARKMINFRELDPDHALAEVSGIRLAANIRVRAYTPDEAVGFFRQGLTDSIALRLAASSGTGTSTGYDFELSTATPNVSAFWTPAAALFKGRFFGHPTTPVKAKLPAGRFCFGVGTSGGTATYDMTTYFDIPALDKGYVAL